MPKKRVSKAEMERQLVADAERSQHVGMGPLSFDNEMARRHGWTNTEIARFWEMATAAYKKISKRMHKRYPERYDLLKDPKIPIYIAPPR